MKKVIIYTLTVAIINSTLTSCLVTYGDTTDSYYSSLTDTQCSKRASTVYTFFEGEELDFSYTKLGTVEVEGEQGASNKTLIDHLKNKAWINCANAIINIKSDFKIREQGMLFNEESEEVYHSKYYSAIAVRVDIDDNFLRKYGKGDSLSFNKRVNEHQEKQSKRTGNQFAGSVILGALGGIVALIAAANEE